MKDLLMEIRKLNDLLGSLVNNKLVLNGDTEYSYKTLASWLSEWRSTYKIKTQSERTYKENGKVIEKYILPFADKELSKITTLELQGIINAIERGRTQKAVYGILRDCFNKAYRLDIIQKNPCENVEIEKYEEKERRALTMKEQNRFVKAIKGHRYELQFLLYLTTGIRKSEIRNLEFDFVKKQILVKGTKNKTSVRYVPLLDILVEPLREYLKQSKIDINYKNLDRHFKAVMNKLKIYDVTLHSLRHTFATRCIENNVPMKVVQTWLGHSTYDMTANRYSHIQDDFIKKQLKTYENAFEKITSFLDKKHIKIS